MQHRSTDPLTLPGWDSEMFVGGIWRCSLREKKTRSYPQEQVCDALQCEGHSCAKCSRCARIGKLLRLPFDETECESHRRPSTKNTIQPAVGLDQVQAHVLWEKAAVICTNATHMRRRSIPQPIGTVPIVITRLVINRPERRKVGRTSCTNTT